MKKIIAGLLIAATLLFSGVAEAAPTKWTRNGVTMATETFVPTTGNTLTLSGANQSTVFVEPAGTLAALTLTMPSSPANGDLITIFSKQNVTAVTFSGGTVNGAPTNFSANGATTFVYSSASGQWNATTTKIAGQSGLDGLYALPGGQNAAPIIAQCAGSGDQATLATAAASATTRRTGIQVGNGCDLNNRWQLTNNSFVSLFGVSPGNMDATTKETSTGAGALTISSNSVATSSPSKLAIDMNGATELSINNLYISGNYEVPPSAIIGNTVQNGGCCAKNALELNNVSLARARTIVGCPIDMGTGLAVSGCSTTANTLPRTIKSQFSIFSHGYAQNISDNMAWMSQYSGGGIISMPQFGGGGNQFLGNRIEFGCSNGPCFWYSSPHATGDTGASYHNSMSIDNEQSPEYYFGRSLGYMANDNSINRPSLSNNFVSTGGFGQDLDWAKGAGWSIDLTNFNAVGTNTSSTLSQVAAIMNGYTYTITADVTVTSGTLTPVVGGVSGTPISASGTAISQTIVGGATQSIGFTGSSFTGTVDNVIVKYTSRRPIMAIGGGGQTVQGVRFSDFLLRDSNGVIDYIAHMNGTAGLDNGVHVSGWFNGANILGSLNTTNETPALMSLDTMGNGSGGYTGEFTRRGVPFGIGPAHPRQSVALDMKDPVNATKSVAFPAGTTAQRGVCDSTHVGEQRYNTSLGTMEVCTGASPSWKGLGDITSASFANYIGGLQIANDVTTPNTTFTVAPGTVTDDTNLVQMQLPAFSKTTAAWAAGSGNGCLDTGTVTTNATYHIFVIAKPALAATGVLCSTSSYAPLMPAGYVYKARVGSFLTDGSANILAFTQRGQKFTLNAMQLALNSVSIGTSASSQTLGFVPSGVKVIPNCQISISNASPPASVLMTGLDEQADVAPTTTVPFGTAAGFDVQQITSAAGVANAACPEVVTNTSRQVRLRASAASTSVSVIGKGWTDCLGGSCPQPKTIVLTSGTSMTLPADWNPNANTVIAIGEGGNGGPGNSTNYGGGGGGGGALAQIFNLSDAAGTSITYQIGTGGSGTNTQFKNGSTLVAAGGANGSSTSGSGAAGGTTAASVGTVKYAGGNGSARGTFTAGGGGGAASLLGAGNAGGASSGTSATGSSAGGSVGGGAAATAGTATQGGIGGAGPDGTGGGTGGVAGNTTTATGGNSTNGGGGGGAFANQTSGQQGGGGGNGSMYPAWAYNGVQYGPGSGGGGGGTNNTTGGNGGNGGGYGGGGGAGAYNNSTGGTGAPGLIVLVYYPIK